MDEKRKIFQKVLTGGHIISELLVGVFFFKSFKMMQHLFSNSPNAMEWAAR
jgi:hypothetical protein